LIIGRVKDEAIHAPSLMASVLLALDRDFARSSFRIVINPAFAYAVQTA